MAGHISFERNALEQWLSKGGEIRGKLNGIGFAQKLNLEVDSAQHLVVRDVSLQGSTLALPGSSAEGLPGAGVTFAIQLCGQIWPDGPD